MGKKVTKDFVGEDFSLSLALVDAIPVILFSINCLIIGSLFKSTLFNIGAIITALSALGKVLWKIIVAINRKNIYFLFIQMRIFMPIGFLMMLTSLFIDKSLISLQAIITAITTLPSCLFFLLGVIGMGLMGYFATHLDNGDLKNNWIEQITNSLSQLAYLIGLLLIK